MKKIYLILLFAFRINTIQAQTTLKYSGNATTTYFGFSYKIAGIADMDVKKVSEQIGTHIGLFGQATNALGLNVGLYGTTSQNTFGSAYSYIGVYGNNISNALNQASANVYGGYFLARNFGANAFTTGAYAVGTGTNNTSTVIGLDAEATNSSNVNGNKTIAVRGVTNSAQSSHVEIYKEVANPGGYFSSNDGQGIYATTTNGFNYSGGKRSHAITGYSNVANADNIGAVGFSEGTGPIKTGLFGGVAGIAATGLSAGIFAYDGVGALTSYSGYFSGKVRINGNLEVYGNSSATGVKTFKIDHPLDPENKILRHAAMESNEVLNQYSGNITTDASGYAIVKMPDYFETLNKDFRYQLTVIGSFAQAIIKREVTGNQFVIQTNQPSVKVSWAVTGVRNDKMMQYAPFVAETEKPTEEKGKYLSPEAYGKPKVDLNISGFNPKNQVPSKE